MYDNGTTVCSNDTSSSTMTFESIEIVFPFLTGKPATVKCSYYCTVLGNTAGCVGFNYWSHARRCDFYATASNSCSRQTGCMFYSVSLLESPALLLIASIGNALIANTLFETHAHSIIWDNNIMNNPESTQFSKVNGQFIAHRRRTIFFPFYFTTQQDWCTEFLVNGD
jgi:hypothetical protein